MFIEKKQYPKPLVFLATSLLIAVTISFGVFITQAEQADGNSFETNSPNPNKPSSISDTVAYELFLRTVAEGNAQSLIRRIGVEQQDADKILQETELLKSVFDGSERRMRELNKRSNKSAAELGNELQQIKRRKEEAVSRTVNYLQTGLSEKASMKLQSFVKNEVKRNIQKIPFETLLQSKNNGSKTPASADFVRTANKIAMPQTGGSVYLYSTAWDDGASVFGSGSISEDYPSGISYLVNVSVATPNSTRTNTTQNGFYQATLANTTGLSIDIDDGTYSVEATFEGQDGYYDEYGSFVPTGSRFYVGTSSSTITVAPLVSIADASGPSAGIDSGATADINFSVFSTRDSPANIDVVVQLNEMVNYDGVRYSVNRSQTVRIVTPGTSKSGSFRIEVSGDSPPGIVRSEVRIESARAGTVAVPPGVAFKEVSFRVNRPLQSVCSECSDPTPGCPCYDGSGGIFGSNVESSCSKEPKFIKATFSPKANFIPRCFCGSSPIIIDVLGNGYAMTNATNGVRFDFNGDGVIIGKLSWTSTNADDAWLVLDRNNNGRIDNGRELFGNATPQSVPPVGEERQGFLALAEYDKPANGGDDNGKITQRDGIFGQLRLWQDRNHNAVSEPEELHRLKALNVVVIELNYTESKRTDEHGNQFKYRAKVRDDRGAQVGRWAWDVFLVTAQ